MEYAMDETSPVMSLEFADYVFEFDILLMLFAVHYSSAVVDRNASDPLSPPLAVENVTDWLRKPTDTPMHVAERWTDAHPDPVA